MKPSKDLRIYAMGRKRFLQIMRCHVTDSGLYTCDAGDASTSCTVEVYGKIPQTKRVSYRSFPIEMVFLVFLTLPCDIFYDEHILGK